jgi:hypothetical protein
MIPATADAAANEAELLPAAQRSPSVPLPVLARDASMKFEDVGLSELRGRA